MSDWKNKLYFGDNLERLREYIPDESVDLVYLDPPFNSSATYNVLFQEQSGRKSAAQITAFEDTWHWGIEAERAFYEIATKGPHKLSELIQAFRSFLGTNDMMAYLAMIGIRLTELYRVLKPAGSIYLHCDPTASHYLKLLMDALFGPANFRNEIIWQRTSAHNDPSRYGRIHDTILFYAKGETHTWNQQFEKTDDSYFAAHDFEKDAEGKLYRKRDLTAPAHGSESGQYEWKGKYPPQGRMWSYTKENMERLEAEGRIAYTRTGMPRLKIYVENLRGVPHQDVWVNPELWLNSAARERLGYPTQKPTALLERIIQTSSNPGDLVLDPFCGCGTAIYAAQKLGRRWIGIDITHLAISLVEKRLRDAFPGIEFIVEGTPKDLDSARDLALRDKYQFQWWACSLVNAQPYQGRKKGADTGIDGLLYFTDAQAGKPIIKKIIVSVKGGENVGAAMVRDLAGTIQANKAEIGLFVTLAEPTKPMETEAAKAGFYRAGNGREYSRIQILTISDLLSGHKRPEYFDMSAGGMMFKKAEKEDTEPTTPKLF